jgi:PAS domain-containing protein
MSTRTNNLHREIELRSRAVAKLKGDVGDDRAPPHATTAMAVLHTLASSASTAGDALAVLHELQVHQVELELQQEEMQAARVELEANLLRQNQLYDHAPVALLSLDAESRIVEMNFATARMLGQERHALVGQALHNFLATDSRTAFNTLLERLRTADGSSLGVELTLRRDPPMLLRATVSADPAGKGFLVSLT